MKDKLKIIMGDLRHTTIGMHVSFMPIAIGYIGAYTIAEIGKENISKIDKL